ncbi:MAG: AAA family ATPase [Rhodospirillales bacterium]|nr:AAA family ATPase [Rhodospirillales bacterium]MDE2198576.1 AAA family ATPase [Rhodospirillales bacterium]MDE2575483.1 AAA family ATPase [Rhodospirillales bacterium]
MPPAATPAATQAATPTGRVIAIASGKGGVGKTWLAISLAHCLARDGARVLLFDADFGLANVDVQLGLLPAHDLLSVLSGADTLEAATLHHATGGFDILAGRSGSGALASLGPATIARITALLHAAAQRYDVVLLDLGAGLEAAVRRLAALADTLLVVATDEPTSLTDAYAVLKLHATDLGPAAPGDARLAINLAASRTAGERTYGGLARACERFLAHRPPLAGIIRRDERVREAIRRQELFLARSPTAPAAQDVEALAAALLPVSLPAG